MTRGRATRSDRAGRLRALGHRAGAAGRRPRRGAPPGAHGIRRAVPRAHRATRCADVTPAEALAHPTWDMGLVVTTNSSTLVNKGLEVIEAHLLFDVPVRPHRGDRASAVDRALDGRVRRRLDDRAGEPARHAAADLARARTGRTASPGVGVPLDWTTAQTLDVRAARRRRLPGRRRSRSGSARRAAPIPAVFNAANEQAVAAFHAGRIGVPRHRRHDRAGRRRARARRAMTLEGVLEAERWARADAPTPYWAHDGPGASARAVARRAARRGAAARAAGRRPRRRRARAARPPRARAGRHRRQGARDPVVGRRPGAHRAAARHAHRRRRCRPDLPDPGARDGHRGRPADLHRHRGRRSRRKQVVVDDWWGDRRR